MTERYATTPFGGAPMRASIFQMNEAVELRRAALRAGEGGNDSGRADKWRLLRALTEAREAYGLGDRTIAVLEALLSFHQGKELDGAREIIVFPSNAELSLRTRGMAPATLRRHLAALVEAGMILRRDSPNGKRYCRRDDEGAIEAVYGFDLAPLAHASAAIHEAADMARAHARATQRLRGEITVHARDIGKVLAAAIEEGRPGAWLDHAERLAPLARRMPRQARLEQLEEVRDGLVRLRAEVEKAYLDSLTEQEMSANDVDSERHIHNSKPECHFDKSFEQNLKPRGQSDSAKPDVAMHTIAGRASGPGDDPGTRQAGAPGGALPVASEAKREPVPLAHLVATCPGFCAYARDGIRDWRDVVTTAGLVRSLLGVSPDAWERARMAMGDQRAAVVIAAIVERVDTIRSPGGYLRALTARAEAGRFSVLPMLAALGKPE